MPADRCPTLSVGGRVHKTSLPGAYLNLISGAVPRDGSHCLWGKKKKNHTGKWEKSLSDQCLPQLKNTKKSPGFGADTKYRKY